MGRDRQDAKLNTFCTRNITLEGALRIIDQLV